MTGSVLYEEQVSSAKTQALFWGLTVLSALLFVLRLTSHGPELLTTVLLLLGLFFLFCSLNYRLLVIRITSEALRLHFGIFTWSIPLSNIQGIALDDHLPLVAKYGGAGIHFMFVRGRYRASLNFLEYPRVVVSLRQSRVVKDVSFSTKHPNEVVRQLERPASPHSAA
jgi:hypothetical protein